ncbi:uncharacterized protein BP01DRAFT_100132 [Aspergillus saccharolyticus JOP 1030-1]|uniref:Uncharacterized protein n=1 Tax=Aspergillus saccharolyticus JOP 1030-1 TaxID=1450539 RepID=A0A318ZTV9_9EURO|nr:hypothetical protein BP01DRAFT_100132 [Aspergillus saccharolyticus JOP 1030-1]PYH43528.1 hypothetical protein BP01DRAFT_100132 [Aspergillus saccharolyticus JOP 1030-1]
MQAETRAHSEDLPELKKADGGHFSCRKYTWLWLWWLLLLLLCLLGGSIWPPKGEGGQEVRAWVGADVGGAEVSGLVASGTNRVCS